ncbi:MAG: hypothetical protein K8W52_32170 [Deltaproteobacteria bacterium]|nr:hypothetical protein [Deltaproteobacteria bacterium]
MTARILALGAALALGACDDTTVTVVTVNARPAVHGATTLSVEMGNDNATLTETFDLRGHGFPTSFSITTPTRAGALSLVATATDEAGIPVALGSTTATIDPGNRSQASLLLEPADFNVNTQVAGSQRTTWAFGAGARQLVAATDGTFTIAFSDDCGALVRCDVWGRRFTANGAPASSAIAAGTAQFNINRTDIFGNDPALALGPTGNLVAVWSTLDNIVCSAIGPDGSIASATEVILSDGAAPDRPAVAALGNRFVVAWQEQAQGTGAAVIRTRLVDASCQPALNSATGSTAAVTVSSVGTPDLAAAATALDGQHAAIVWRSGTAVRGTFMDATGMTNGEQALLEGGSDSVVWGLELAGIDGGYGLVYGHRSTSASLPDGGFVLRRMGPTGTLLGVETTIVTPTPDVQSAPAIARRGDGAIGIAWHDCTGADGSGCAIRAIATTPAGAVVGTPLVVDTSTAGDQTDPSIGALPDGFAVTWTDGSLAEPDKSETGIRARIVYPAY